MEIYPYIYSSNAVAHFISVNFLEIMIGMITISNLADRNNTYSKSSCSLLVSLCLGWLMLMVPQQVLADIFFDDLWEFSNDSWEPAGEWRDASCLEGPIHEQRVKNGEKYTFRIQECYCGSTTDALLLFAEDVTESLQRIVEYARDRALAANIDTAVSSPELRESIEKARDNWIALIFDQHGKGPEGIFAFYSSKYHDEELQCVSPKVQKDVMCFDMRAAFGLHIRILRQAAGLVMEAVDVPQGNLASLPEDEFRKEWYELTRIRVYEMARAFVERGETP